MKLDKPEAVHFKDVDMEEISLLETDVRKVEFTDVEWPEKLRDELEGKNYALVEKLNHRLRMNYEEQSSYPDAGRFYYGEMEMRRKAMWWPRRALFSLTAIYCWTSGYGQRPRRALGWLAGLLVAFGVAYMMAGLQGPQTIDWDWGNSWPGVWESLRQFSSSFLHAMQVAVFSRVRTYTPFNRWGEALIIAETILAPLQAAMFVLAVRRSFKR